TVDPKEVPIITETLTSFRVKSIGVYSNVRSTIEVVVVDVDQIAYRVANKVFEENPPTPPPVQPGQPAPPAPVAPPAPKIAPGMPRILYWTEY
ncbi:MAG: hypothetical protein ACK5V3_17745, partial [Bdellovibrionales bacterium]